MDEPGRIVARDALERVAEGVAEVEKRAVAFLALVAHHHGGLGPAALRHGLIAFGAALEHAAPMASHQSKKTESPIRPYFTTSA